MSSLHTRNDPNYLGAFLSFLRVLATNVSTALLPLFIAKQEDGQEYPTVTALVIATVVSFLLTVVNFFRSGETRFGPPPNVVEGDHGASSTHTLAVVALIIAVVALLFILL